MDNPIKVQGCTTCNQIVEAIRNQPLEKVLVVIKFGNNTKHQIRVTTLMYVVATIWKLLFLKICHQGNNKIKVKNKNTKRLA